MENQDQMKRSRGSPRRRLIEEIKMETPLSKEDEQNEIINNIRTNYNPLKILNIYYLHAVWEFSKIKIFSIIEFN